MPGATGRILNALDSPTQSDNWIHGHVINRRGNAYSGWNHRVDKTTLGVKFDWLIMCGSTSFAWPGNYVIDQLDVGIEAPKPHVVVRLNINCIQASDFNVHSVYIWASELSNRQMKVVTTALRAQLGGTPDGIDQAPVVPMEVSPTAYCAQCPTGFHMDSGTDSCNLCPADTYGNSCTDCPAGTSSPAGSGEILDCVCVPGHTADSNGIECTACVQGTYKATTGVGVCSVCPGGAHSPVGSTEEEACSCIDGYFMKEQV